MNFNSVQFVLFLPACIVLYYLLPYKGRKLFLLAASYLFYMNWNARYALLLATCTLITYLGALGIWHVHLNCEKKLLLLLTILPNLGILFFFKYTNFFIRTVNKALPLHLSPIDILLPVGISFYIFQAIGYTIDVYRGGYKSESDFITFALFVSFFPQLVAGPIERSRNLLPQLQSNHRFSKDNIATGARLILAGMFKKIVIADMLAIFVDNAWTYYQYLNSLCLFAAVIAFSIQIYCDFSGYSDIARGSARLMGIELCVNFSSPYFSQSIREFWNRWHISLSTWFRDYIYFPLGGGKKGLLRKCLNLSVVFLVSGIWHGATWGFVAWGFLHGTARILEELVPILKERTRSHILSLVKMACTFMIVSLLWIFFRSGGLHNAFLFIGAMMRQCKVGEASQLFELIKKNLTTIPHPATVWTVIISISCVVLFLCDFIKVKTGVPDDGEILARLPLALRWFSYYIMTFLCMFCFLIMKNEYGQAGAFIYFQF